MPQPQAERTVVAGGSSQRLVITWEPVIAVTLVFDEQQWPDIDGVFVNDDPVITWIADDGKRRGDDAPVLVAHVNPVFAAGHLEDPSGVLPNVIAATRRVLGIEALPSWSWAHRWSLARPIAALDEEFWMHPELPVSSGRRRLGRGTSCGGGVAVRAGPWSGAQSDISRESSLNSEFFTGFASPTSDSLSARACNRARRRPVGR
jgi:predicted NAD/FAD-dependent oxidoreductase